MIPGCLETFVLDPQPLVGVPLEQVERKLPDQGEVLGGVLLALPAFIFPECHVQHPVQRILHAPVIKKLLEKYFPRESSNSNFGGLPLNLAILAPLLTKWAVSDDHLRHELIDHSDQAEIEEVVSIVSPLMPEINSYLDGFQGKSMPDEAMLVGNLAELVSELECNWH